VDRPITAVAGGAGATGRAIVTTLQAGGHRVVVIDRDAEIAADLGDEALTRRAAAGAAGTHRLTIPFRLP
jgi:nucleoside-diphosphate-sugar epimerase